MPVMMQRVRLEDMRIQEQGPCQTNWNVTRDELAPSLRIGLINNMPDAALEATETQFCKLIGSAAGDIPIHLALYSLPNISRSDWAQRHLNKYYFGIDELWKNGCDAVIITGTEPLRPNLREEAYWPVLAEVFDWAASNTHSAVLSCLAAHAGVLYNDGIERHRLKDKQFGVFEFKRANEHALTHGVAKSVRHPHSRWNEVREDDLVSCGYTVLAKSDEAGVDTFVKKCKQSLFVHFQGHPEYSTQTLLKEYRRDIGRFLRRERETYPSMPQGYLDADRNTRALAEEFQEIAISQRDEDFLASFPDDVIANSVQNTWQSSATCVYRNWIQYVLSRKAEAAELVAAPESGQIQRRRSAA